MLLQTRSAHLKGKSIDINGTSYAVGADLCIDVEDEVNANKALACGWTEDVIQTKATRRGTPTVPKPSISSAKAFVQLVAAQPALQAQCEVCQTFSELLKTVANANGYNFNVDQLNQARAAHVARNADIKPGGGAPQHSKLARQAAAVAATVPVVAKTDDEISTPFGSYSKAVLKALAKEMGITEPAILAAAFELDQAEAQSGYHSEDDLRAAALTLLPEGASAIPEAENAQRAEAAAKAEQLAAEEAQASQEAEALAAEEAAASGYDASVYEESGNWPKPTADMPIAFLKKMADAYEVKYAPNIGVETLVGRIVKKMFPDE